MLPIERTILRELFADQQFAEKVTPYLKEEYFSTADVALIYKLYFKFFEKFHAVPQFSVIGIGLDAYPNINEREAKDAKEALEEIKKEPELDPNQDPWLLETVEEFCQEKAVYCALKESIKVMDDPKATRHVIPDLLKEALAVSFDQHVGHDFFEDADARWDFYHKPEARIPFDLQVLQQMTKGGVPKKTLNIVMAGTNVGKSLFLTHTAAAYLKGNKNVLYLTMEMSEEVTAQRIDANLMDIPMNDVEMLPRSDYIRKVLFLRNTCKGRLIIKQYPTAQAHTGHFRSLLQELRLKQNFVPDAIMVDYLTICASTRVKMGSGAVNSYTLYKFVAEELRGLAVEFDVPVWTAAQFNRQGFDSSEADITNVGESWAIPQTADFMFALVQTDELQKIGQIALQPMKNRYQEKKSYQQELLGIDTNRMKLYDLSPSQKAITTAGSAPTAPAVPTSGTTSVSNNKFSLNTLKRPRRRPLSALKRDVQSDT